MSCLFNYIYIGNIKCLYNINPDPSLLFSLSKNPKWVSVCHLQPGKLCVSFSSSLCGASSLVCSSESEIGFLCSACISLDWKSSSFFLPLGPTSTGLHGFLVSSQTKTHLKQFSISCSSSNSGMFLYKKFLGFFNFNFSTMSNLNSVWMSNCPFCLSKLLKMLSYI